MSDFMNIHNLKNLVRHLTRFKKPDRPSCIDLILTNKKKSFQLSILIETGISDFYKMFIAILKQYFKKQESRAIKYRSHKYFCNNDFRLQLLHELNKELIKISDLDHFNPTVLKVLDN